MSDCKRCAAPVHDEYNPPGGLDDFLPFEILAVIDSAHNPVEQDIFNKTERPKGVDVKLFDKRPVQDSDFRGRPAIALGSGELQPTEGGLVRTRVLLTATYWGRYPKRRHLPLILQCFGVGIYEHETIVEDPLSTFHLHTDPEWTNSHLESHATNAWLIAREYEFEGELGPRRRWLNVNRTDRASCSSFTVEDELQNGLRQVIKDAWEDWTYTCEFDPKTLDKCVADYLKFSNKLVRHRKQTGNVVPPKQTPYRNTRSMRKKTPPSEAAARAQEGQGPANRKDPSPEMYQKKPIQFAHASLARPIIDESVVFASLNALDLAPDDIAIDRDAERPLEVEASGTSTSTGPALVASRAVDESTIASTASAAYGKGSSATPLKASYADKLKAGASSSCVQQRTVREMVPS